MVKVMFVKCCTDGAHAAIHHVRRCYGVTAGLCLNERLFDQDVDRFVVENFIVVQQSIMAMCRIRIERDIAHGQHVRRGGLYGADRRTDQIVGIERFGAVWGFLRRVGERENCDGGYA